MGEACRAHTLWVIWRVSAKMILTRVIWELEMSPSVVVSRREGKGWSGMLRPRSTNLDMKTAIRRAHTSSKAKQIRTSKALFRTTFLPGMSWKSELCLMSSLIRASQWWLSGKEFTCQWGDVGSIPGSGRSPGEGNGYPLQCFCLENPMDRGIQSMGLQRRWTRLSTHRLLWVDCSNDCFFLHHSFHPFFPCSCFLSLSVSVSKGVEYSLNGTEEKMIIS